MALCVSKESWHIHLLEEEKKGANWKEGSKKWIFQDCLMMFIWDYQLEGRVTDLCKSLEMQGMHGN